MGRRRRGGSKRLPHDVPHRQDEPECLVSAQPLSYWTQIKGSMSTTNGQEELLELLRGVLGALGSCCARRVRWAAVAHAPRPRLAAQRLML